MGRASAEQGLRNTCVGCGAAVIFTSVEGSSAIEGLRHTSTVDRSPPRLAGRSRVPAAQEVGGAQANVWDQQHAYLRGNWVPVEHAYDLEAQALLFGAMENHIDWAGDVA